MRCCNPGACCCTCSFTIPLRIAARAVSSWMCCSPAQVQSGIRGPGAAEVLMARLRCSWNSHGKGSGSPLAGQRAWTRVPTPNLRGLTCCSAISANWASSVASASCRGKAQTSEVRRRRRRHRPEWLEPWHDSTAVKDYTDRKTGRRQPGRARCKPLRRLARCSARLGGRRHLSRSNQIVATHLGQGLRQLQHRRLCCAPGLR